MVNLWMVYYCFTNIFRIATTIPRETQADPHARNLELLRLDFPISADTLRPGMIGQGTKSSKYAALVCNTYKLVKQYNIYIICIYDIIYIYMYGIHIYK
jgi:hypothetical protein